jgi:hypothetical protein
MPAMASRTLLAVTFLALTSSYRAPRAWAQATAPDVIAPAAAPAPAVPTAPSVDPDVALERVLRSGCRDGLAAIDRLADNPNAPWSATVSRLCRRILHMPAANVAPPRVQAAVEPRRDKSVQEGRGRLVLWSSLYGLWLGIATDLMFDIDNERLIILPPLLGMGAGLGVSLALTSGVPISAGQAWTIITGLDYGSFNGALWAGSFDLASKGVIGTTVASSVAATSIAIAVADAKSPSAGAVEVVRSSLLWGTVGGALGLAALAPSSGVDEHTALRSIAVTMDLSFALGLVLAHKVNVSRNRVLIIDAGAIGGTLTGLGLVWLASGDPNDSGRAIAAGGLLGLLAGIGVAAYFTSGMDDHDAGGASISGPPGLFAFDAKGRLQLGTPGPMPVFDGTGRRVIGATFSALSGSF